MIQRIATIALLTLLCVAPNHAQVNKAPDGFPLMAWDYISDEPALAAMAECGINYIAFVPVSMLDLCERYGVKAIVFDPAVSGNDWTQPFNADAAVEALPGLIAEVNDHPAVAGYHLRDEPVAGEYPAMARAVAVIRELAPGKWPYINLYPGDGPAYQQYLDEFVSVVNPTTLSYDRYVLAHDGSFSPAFWLNLDHYRLKSLETGLPFWNVVLTAPHFSYRELSQADLRIQIYGSLAYGADGIGFYKFQSRSLPVLNAPDLGNFRMAPLDNFGDRTATWDWLRRINKEVHNLGPTLLQLTSNGVYHYGGISAGLAEPPEDSLIASFTNLPAGPGDAGYVVGEFTHADGSRYVMAVNKSLSDSYQCVPEFRDKPTTVEYVDPVTGKLRLFPSPWYWLAPGQGVLLKITH